MVELISKISKGSKMDQVYIPKKRVNFAVGSYVVIKPVEAIPKKEIKPFFYNIEYLEPIKLMTIKQIFTILDELVESDNLIIVGSFLERGFKFNDIDILIINEKKIDINKIEEILGNKIGAKFHIISLNNKVLLKGLSTDPLYRDMLSRCISKKRFIYKEKPKLNYKLLDLHLLKSKPLIDNFEFLTGDEKYEMTRNLIAIAQFIDKKEITKEKIDFAIEKNFGAKTIYNLKNNLVKNDFLIKYKKIYEKTQNKILRGIKDEQS